MATRIRLRRVGRKKQPEYRIVVTDKAAARDGRFIETLGYYRPRSSPAEVKVDLDRAKQWIAQGATPSDTVASLLKKAAATPGASTSAAAAPAAPVAEVPAAEAPAAETPPADDAAAPPAPPTPSGEG